MPLLPLFADAELVTPAPGLMIWTLLVFFLSFIILFLFLNCQILDMRRGS